jgi:hypothetical protein
MRPLFMLPLMAGVLIACGRDRGAGGGKPEAERGAPFRGPGHGTGEPGSGYGGQTDDKGKASPVPDDKDATRSPDRAQRPGTGNAQAQ